MADGASPMALRARPRRIAAARRSRSSARRRPPEASLSPNTRRAYSGALRRLDALGSTARRLENATLAASTSPSSTTRGEPPASASTAVAAADRQRGRPVCGSGRWVAPEPARPHLESDNPRSVDFPICGHAHPPRAPSPKWKVGLAGDISWGSVCGSRLRCPASRTGLSRGRTARLPRRSRHGRHRASASGHG